jgi:hypothetical protein
VGPILEVGTMAKEVALAILRLVGKA